MPARTGAAFLAGLKDGRELWLGDERVDDPASHPALVGAAWAIADVFDLHHAHPEDCLMPDPETGEPIAVSHMIPRSRSDLEQRHRALERVAEFSVGLMGRTPDYVNVTFAGFAGDAAAWAAYGNDRGAEALVAYQAHMARADLSLTHAIVHQTVDKARGPVPAGFDPVQLHKVADTAHGIVVRGSRVLATLAPFADDMAVYPAAPMPDADPRHALCFSIPMNTPGLKLLCRDSVSLLGNRFDHPLSSRFDEQDAFVIFDDVEVPRDRLFIDGNLAVYNSAVRTTWWPNILQQTMIRAQVKLEFAWGLATLMTEAIGSHTPPVQQMLGEIWTFGALARAAIRAAEVDARDPGNGMWYCDLPPLVALRTSFPRWFPRVNEIYRELGAHNLLTTPSTAQLADPALRPLLERYLGGVGDIDAERRSRIFRLAWDFAGTGLASRNEQYERFYLGSAGRNLMQAHQRMDRTRATSLVERFLQEPLDPA
ncbi:MAG: 4-hydroxyphenylacetate 3-hydroxylase N-terminal domain-containing protein [Acetobacteraceae bacterium]